jgi:flagellar basal body-associated protein FliL
MITVAVIVVIGIVVAFVAAVITSRVLSSKRVEEGRKPLPATSWMLPSYPQSQQQTGNPAVAPYVTQPPPNGYYQMNEMGQSSPYGPPADPPPDYEPTDTNRLMFGAPGQHRAHAGSHSGAALATSAAAAGAITATTI